jgi:acyl carrier protein
MNTMETIRIILTEILDIEGDAITPESYIIRDLDTESIDLLEIAVALNAAFKIEIKDDQIFLKNIRLFIREAEEKSADIAAYLLEQYPFLDEARIAEILADKDQGPVLKVKDLVSYLEAGH